MDHCKNTMKYWALSAALLLASQSGWGDDIANCKAQGGTVVNLRNGIVNTGITVAWTLPNGTRAWHKLAPVIGYGILCCKRGTKINYAGSCGCPTRAECLMAMGSDKCEGDAYGDIGSRFFADCKVEVSWDRLEV